MNTDAFSIHRLLLLFYILITSKKEGRKKKWILGDDGHSNAQKRLYKCMGEGMNFCQEHSSFPYGRLHLIRHLNTNNKNKIIKKRDEYVAELLY